MGHSGHCGWSWMLLWLLRGLCFHRTSSEARNLRVCWRENKKGDRMVAEAGIADLLFSNWSSGLKSLIRRIHWASA